MRSRAINPTVKMSNVQRDKISSSLVLEALIAHAEGRHKMTGTQVRAGIALLKKVLPDLRQVELAGQDGGPIEHNFSVIFKSAKDVSEIENNEANTEEKDGPPVRAPS